MKPFNLEEAKAGKPVCTRNGRNARIICFDVKGSPFPLIALVETKGEEYYYTYTKNGQITDEDTSTLDLLMKPEKHEGWGWLNKYATVYKTKEEAVSHEPEFVGEAFLAKVEWEE